MKNSLLLALVALSVSFVPARAATVALSGPSTVNGLFDVVVNVTNVFAPPHDTDSFLGYGFDITYDNTVLTYLGETAGPLFTDLTGQPGLGAQVAGFATAILLNPGDFVEPLQLATLHFGVIGAGVSSISISSDPLNLDQGLIYLNAYDSIAAGTRVTALAAAVPEPGTLLLGALGIAAIWNRKRKR
jgi:PEP-CTERM motif